MRLLNPKLNNKNDVLFVRIDNKIGDMIIFTDSLIKFSKQFPNYKIHLLLHKSLKGIFEPSLLVSKITYININAQCYVTFLLRPFIIFKFMKDNDLLRAYKISINNRSGGDLYAPFIILFSCANFKIGFSSKMQSRGYKFANLMTDYFYTSLIIDKPNLHESQRNLLFLSQIFGVKRSKLTKISYQVWPAIGDFNNVNLIIKKNDLADFIIFGIGASDVNRIWPSSYYAELIRNLSRNAAFKNKKFILFGSNSDLELSREIVKFSKMNFRESRLVNLVNKLNINECSILLKKCSLFVGNDSALIHLASSQDCKIIEISAFPKGLDSNHPNSPDRFGPISSKKIILQPSIKADLNIRRKTNINYFLINKISVDSVYKSILNILRA